VGPDTDIIMAGGLHLVDWCREKMNTPAGDDETNGKSAFFALFALFALSNLTL